MFDKYLLVITKYPLSVFARICIKYNISPNMVTVGSLFFALSMFVGLWRGWFVFALIVAVCNRIMDGLDGSIARISNTKSVSGGFLDIVIDYVFYAAVPLGMAFYSPNRFAIIGSVVLFTYTLSGVTFMASSSAAAKLSLRSTAFSQKSIYYPINLIEGGETIIFSFLVCIIPQYFFVLGLIMALSIMCSLPFRIWLHYKTFRENEDLNMHS